MTLNNCTIMINFPLNPVSTKAGQPQREGGKGRAKPRIVRNHGYVWGYPGVKSAVNE